MFWTAVVKILSIIKWKSANALQQPIRRELNYYRLHKQPNTLNQKKIPSEWDQYVQAVEVEESQLVDRMESK